MPDSFHLLLHIYSLPFSTLFAALKGDLNWFCQKTPMLYAFQFDLVSDKPWQVTGGREKKWVCGIYLSGSFLGGFLCQQKLTVPLRSPLFVTFIFQVLVTFSFTHAFVLRGSDNFASSAGGPRILSSSCWFPYILPIPTFVINPFIKSLQIMLIGECHLFPVDSLTSKPPQVKIPWESAVPHWLT